jgi:hypothetical protein
MMQNEAEMNLVRLTAKLAAFLMIDQLRIAFGTHLISILHFVFC